MIVNLCPYQLQSTHINIHSSLELIRVWNGLLFSVVHASSVNLSKASIVLNKYYFISFLFLSAACVICYSSPHYIQFNVIVFA